ncbi:hypothetical protein MW887_004347 [Aspergillus wentii]|nr:hypothetical protein MW887_004347 [Aspergillus wentii]
MIDDERAGWKITSKLQRGKLLAGVNCLAGLAIFFFGYDQGMMGGINNSNAYLQQMGIGHVENKEAVVKNSLLEGGIVSVYYLGTLVGCFLGGSVSDRFGRIKSFAFGATWGIIGATLQCTAQNPTWMIIARLINGIGTGVLNGTVPVYGSEIAEYHSRGQFIAMEFTLNIFGVVVAYWLGFGLSYVDNGQSEFQWRFPVAFQNVMLLTLLGACWFFPESPRWLCMVGRREEALYVLTRLRGEGEAAQTELMEIEVVVELEQEAKHTSYFHMLFGFGGGKLAYCPKSAACDLVADSAKLVRNCRRHHVCTDIAGFDSQKALWISGLNNIFYTLATLICVFTLDRIGRRWTLWWGAAGQAITMFLAGGLSRGGLNDTAHQEAWGIGATSMVYLYTFIFGATWLTVPWLYPAEIFPLKLRAKGNAWGVVGWSLGNGSLTLALPYIFSAIGEGTLYVFGAVNLISIPIVWALYPESSQRTLEEIDLLFTAKSPWVWAAEANFEALRAENPELGASRHGGISDNEKVYGSAEHADKV